MAAIPNPLGAVKNFAQAFRASKKGLRPAHFAKPIYSEHAPEAARLLREVRWKHGSLNDAIRSGQDYVGGSQRFRRALARQQSVSDIRGALALTRGEVPLSRAERYGGILGKGFRQREPLQLNLFTGLAHQSRYRASTPGFRPEVVWKGERRAAFREMKTAMRRDFEAIPFVDAFKRGKARRYGMAGANNPQAIRSKFGYVAGRLFRKGMPMREKLAGLRDYARGVVSKPGEHGPGVRFRWGLHEGGVRRQRNYRSRNMRDPFYGAGFALGSLKPGVLVDKARSVVAKGQAKYDRVAGSVNRRLARVGIGKNPKIDLKTFAPAHRLERSGIETPQHGIIQEYQVRANRVPLGVAGVTATEYGRVAKIDAIPLIPEKRAPGFPAFSARTGAPMRERIRNIRQTFEAIRRRHPAAHDFILEKAIPKSRQVRELEQMVGEESPVMKARRLRYTRRPHKS